MVNAGEINDEERKAFHAREYVITDTMAEGLRRVVSSIAESADKGFSGQGVWVSGSFGTGKSHFLSFAGMLLRGDVFVNRKHGWEATAQMVALAAAYGAGVGRDGGGGLYQK